MYPMRTLVAILVCLPLSVFAANNHPAQVAGVYEGSVPVKNSDARKVTLNLLQDGSLQWKDGAMASGGQWSASSQQLEVKLTTGNQMLAWKIRKNALVLEGGEKASYGEKGLVLRRPR